MTDTPLTIVEQQISTDPDDGILIINQRFRLIDSGWYLFRLFASSWYKMLR